MAELSREQLLIAVITGRGAAYLRGVDLSRIDLTNAGWLMDADLRFANLSNAILKTANLRGALLEKANLDSANLSGATLEEADLRGAKLAVANLRSANLRSAKLQGANLVGASLAKSILESANLEDADLEGANLEGANLNGAVLDGANLRMANLRGTILDNANSNVVQDENDKASGTEPPKNGHGFTGSFTQVRLTDLIQLICLSHSDILLQVQSGSGTGNVHIRAGKVCHAEMGAVSGEEAFMGILQWEKGRLDTLPLPDKNIITIDKPLEHLLIESLRRRDEGVL